MKVFVENSAAEHEISWLKDDKQFSGGVWEQV
jgi:hypothetical protein